MKYCIYQYTANNNYRFGFCMNPYNIEQLRRQNPFHTFYEVTI